MIVALGCGNGSVSSSLLAKNIMKKHREPSSSSSPDSYYKSHHCPSSLQITSCSGNSNNNVSSAAEVVDEESIWKIKQMFAGAVDISESAYDTAWVAMVPSPEREGRRPRFPQCLKWVMENQRRDGSWGLAEPHHPQLVKDSLSATLACILALRKWEVGDLLVERGLDYMRCNSWAINGEDQISPLGFDIVFPGMIHYSYQLKLNLPLHPVLMDTMLHRRESQIQRMISGNSRVLLEMELECVGEGVMGMGSNLWDNMLQFQPININIKKGLFSNSPAFNAARFMRCGDNQSFQYLQEVLSVYEEWVPTIYPVSTILRLRMVDTLQRLGVCGFFKEEIRHVLEETYRYWQQKHKEIFSDIMCSAIAFRLLRENGYNVSSEELEGVAKVDECGIASSIICPATILELYRASRVKIYQNEQVLDKIEAWTSSFLNKRLLITPPPSMDRGFYEEVKHSLKHSHGMPERIKSRRSIEIYQAQKVHIMKTSFRWYKDCRLDLLDFPKHYLYTSYFLVAATLFEPEFSEARFAWAQSTMFVTIAGNLIENRCTMEELVDLRRLAKEWDGYSLISDDLSEQVRIFLSALRSTVDDQAAKALIHQGRSVRHHLISMWQELIENMMKEVDWWDQNASPSMEEYLSVGCKTVGNEVVALTGMYFVGEKISEDMLSSAQFGDLCSHALLIARLYNDLQTSKKEVSERTVNSVSLQVSRGRHEEEAASNIKAMIESSRREFLHKSGSGASSSVVVPEICKRLLWTTIKLNYYLYSESDEFNSPSQQIIHDMDDVIYHPLVSLSPHQRNLRIYR